MIIGTLDKTAKEIFRSWNWPSEPFTNFSQRPTPYKISKLRYLNPGVVYKSWNQLFDRGDVRNVYFLPEDWLVDRRVVALPGISRDDVKSILSILEKAYFLEMMHSGHVYSAKGKLEVLKNGGETLVLELVGSSDELMIKQTALLLEILNHEVNPIYLPPGNNKVVELNEKLLKLARRIAYSDIYKIDVNSLSEEYRTTSRTINRRIDTLIEMEAFRGFPLLNQSVIAGTNVMVVNGQFKPGMQKQAVLEQVFSKQIISENYLLYRVMNNSLNMLLNYDSAGELDQCIAALDDVFDDMLAITRFETFPNPQIFRT